MCQLCAIKGLVDRERWPKPLEHHKDDIKFLVTSAHEEHEKWVAQKSAGTKQDNTKECNEKFNIKPTIPQALLDSLRLLDTLLEDLDAEHAKWWSSPQKRGQRRRLEEEGDQKKLSAAHKINNAMNEVEKDMHARIGLYVKWSLGMNGGIWELQKGLHVHGESK